MCVLNVQKDMLEIIVRGKFLNEYTFCQQTCSFTENVILAP